MANKYQVVEIGVRHFCGKNLAHAQPVPRKVQFDLENVQEMARSGVDDWQVIIDTVGNFTPCLICGNTDEFNSLETIFALTYEQVGGPELNLRVMRSPQDTLNYPNQA